MDARHLPIGALCALVFTVSTAAAATYTTPNFVVTAPTDDIARRVGECAEFWRKDLAVQWLGQPLPNWYKPCPISVKVGQIGAGGQTTFTFENGEVYGWKMSVQGSLERVLDSVIPHEVNHTIFASHFRRPLPRWADEGAATLFEHESERARQTRLLDQVLHTSRRIPLKQLLAIREYPEDMQDVLTLYAEGYSLAEFLVGTKGTNGRQVYLQFLNDAHQQGWERAIQQHYGYKSVSHLEENWNQWIMAGSPEFNLPEGQLLAQADQPDISPAAEEPVIRGQSAPPADPLPLAAVPRPLRTASRNAPEQELTADYALESDPRRPAANPSQGVRQPRPEPRPAALAPTADQMEVDPQSKSYAFPSVRR